MTLDREEKEILKSFENNEWKSVMNDDSLERYSSYARYTLKKNKRINLRLSERDYWAIKKIAEKEGIPYQTLIASLVHKFIEEKFEQGSI